MEHASGTTNIPRLFPGDTHHVMPHRARTLVDRQHSSQSTMDIPTGQRKFTGEEKRQLVANLDIEGQCPFFCENSYLDSEFPAGNSCSSNSPIRIMACRPTGELYNPPGRTSVSDTQTSPVNDHAGVWREIPGQYSGCFARVSEGETRGGGC